MISSDSVTLKAPATLSDLMAMMPEPPLDWVRYSLNSVRFPSPLAPAISSFSSLLTISIATTASCSFLSLMPRTPRVARP